MKRILSILLSISIVASLLVSMSVTSFAADKTLFTDTTPSADTTLDITIEKGDPEIAAENEMSNMYVITFTLDNYGTLSAWKASNKQNGTRIAGIEIGLVFDKETHPSMGWFYEDESTVQSADTDFYNDDSTIEEGEEHYYNLWWAKTAANAYPPGTSTTAVNVSDPVVMKTIWDMPTDTFKVTIGHQQTPICYTFQDYTAGNNAGAKRCIGLASAPQTTVPIEFPSVIYVKDGVQVTEEEYYGSSEPATHSFVVYGEGDVELANETIAEGEAVSMPVAPAVEGKTFSHWATTKGGSAVEPATTMGTEDLTYYAVYTVNKYTITFVVDGNTTTKEVEHGVIPTFDGSLVKDGWTFTGWDKEIVAATGDVTYTAQFEQNAPTQYEITFIVNGVETKVMTNAGDTPVFTGSTEVDGFTFKGWNPTLAPATGAATYTAILEPVEEPADSAVTITNVTRITGDIFPESGLGEVTVTSFGNDYKVSAARLHRVHTTFNYDASAGTLKEMGMLFVPKAVADEAGVSTAEEIANAGIAKDANCRSLPAEITGGTTGVVFKAGLVDVPAELKGITIYAIPYYTLSGGTRQYHDVINTTF